MNREPELRLGGGPPCTSSAPSGPGTLKMDRVTWTGPEQRASPRTVCKGTRQQMPRRPGWKLETPLRVHVTMELFCADGNAFVLCSPSFLMNTRCLCLPSRTLLGLQPESVSPEQRLVLTLVNARCLSLALTLRLRICVCHRDRPTLRATAGMPLSRPTASRGRPCHSRSQRGS